MAVASPGQAPARRDRLTGGCGCWWPPRSPTTSSRGSWRSLRGPASSTALVGFGLDSVIEVVLGRRSPGSSPPATTRCARPEKTALRIIAVSFFALACYVTVDAVGSLAGGGAAGRSRPGIVLAAASLVVMPLLSAGQRRAGRELGSASAVADSRQTLLCTYLSGVLLAGLIVNLVLGWSWADPAAALASPPSRPRRAGTLARGRLLRHPVHAGHRAERLRLPAGV